MRTLEFLGGNPMWEKTTVVVIFVFIFYYKGKQLTILYWCSLMPVCKDWPAKGYNVLLFSGTHWKGASTPWSHLPAPTGWDLQPHDHIYQLSLTGSYDFLTKGSNPQHLCGPRFIIFHTTYTSLKTSNL